ncbi:hypothetical protein [Spirochaeta dissipatitropha]
MLRAALISLLFLSVFPASARDVQSVRLSSAERQNYQWYAANSVWMQGPPIGWVQSGDLANAVGRHKTGAAADWNRLVPADFLDTVRNHISESFAAADFVQNEWLYISHGMVAAERTEWNDGRGRQRAEIILFTSGRSEDSYLRFYNSSGAMLLELAFQGEHQLYLDIFEYRGTQLQQVSRFDSHGEVEYRDSFVYRDEGALRQVERRYPDGTSRSSQYSFHSGVLRDELHRLPDGSMLLVRFDSGGRINQERIIRNETIVEQTVFHYENSAIRQPLRSETDLFERNRRILRNYEAGLIVSEMEYAGNDLLKESGWEYSEERRIIRRWTEKAGQREVREFAYAEDGSLSEERLLIDSELQEIRSYEGQSEILEMYRRSEAVLRVYFSEGRRIREEVLHAGEIIRVREFE